MGFKSSIKRTGYCECGHLLHPNDVICTDCLTSVLCEPDHPKRQAIRNV